MNIELNVTPKKITHASTYWLFGTTILALYLYLICSGPALYNTFLHTLAFGCAAFMVYMLTGAALFSILIPSVRAKYLKSHQTEDHLPLWQDIVGYVSAATLAYMNPSPYAPVLWCMIVIASFQDFILRFAARRLNAKEATV